PVFSENRLMQCSCAKGKCAISSTGEVYPCIGAPIPSGNIREQSFADIWQRSPVLNRIRNLKHEDFSSCQGCDLRPYCQRSSGAVYANTGDYTAAEPWVCQEAAVLKEVHESRTKDKSP
ncbi:MAG: SPASM domain-containing protein, partial [Myxococcota bacterium]|nr:SPASM domain-containing protein [Myxococcota bacterium]